MGRREKQAERSSSFYRRTAPATELRLPNLRTHETTPRPQQLTKLLLNVTVHGSVGRPMHVVATSNSTVGDLIALAVWQYAKEGRRPILPSTEPARFDLHRSQFSLDSLDRDEKVTNLGFRNFFLFRKVTEDEGETESSGSVSCVDKAERAV
uniref:DUF7054 domain-containing protein n=1 Tax=Kalanchoe fedtschenkoi TaxID=63787 RepID=A0A7N0UA24_KALFE